MSKLWNWVSATIAKSLSCPVVARSGGFGRTYLAEDLDKLQGHCVIKQFAPQLQGSKALQKATQMFEQEARRLEHLGEHPQIPTLQAYFEQDFRLYLVQQYIQGQTLAELQQYGVYSEQRVGQLLFDLLNILNFVHAQQVIHRDIKPENIMRHQSDGKLMLIDFGIAKQLTAIAAKPGTMVGTFGYVPSEQMQAGEAYHSSDLYSLGATCFHLLTNIHPWELWKQQGYGWLNNWQQHLSQPVSQELRQILGQMLQEDRTQRYQSAEAVLVDLNRLLCPAIAPLPTPVYEIPAPEDISRLLPLAIASSSVTQIVSDTLKSDEQLTKGQFLTSNNGRYQLILQEDGNLVLYEVKRALWSSRTNGKAVSRCVMQSDGNLVIYGFNKAIWASRTDGNAGAYLIVQDDGNVVIYVNDKSIWATNTNN